MVKDIREIAVDQLLLQGNCSGSYNQRFVPSTGNGQSGHGISNGLSGTCSSLNDSNGLRKVWIAQSIRDLGNHLTLPPTRF